MDINEHERLSNITLRHKVKEQLVVRNDMDVNERLPNITLRHTLSRGTACRYGRKWTWDYPTLQLETN